MVIDRALGPVAVVVLGALMGACATYRPPFTAAAVAAPADPQQATLVFLWPRTSCDPGGYYTLATSDGRFVGNIAAGTQLRAVVPAGETTVIGWSEEQDAARGVVVPVTVSALHGTLAAGRTYYVRMLFGEWDERGPREAFARRSGTRLCIAPDQSMATAMVSITPSGEAWKDLPAWTSELDALAADQATGQAWLDRNRQALDYHRAVGQRRFDGLRPLARRLATLQADDGVTSSL